MATDIITLKSTVPGTKEYAEAQAQYLRYLVALIAGDCWTLRDRLIELKKNGAWLHYFQDADKTWGCFLARGSRTRPGHAHSNCEARRETNCYQ